MTLRLGVGNRDGGDGGYDGWIWTTGEGYGVLQRCSIEEKEAEKREEGGFILRFDSPSARIVRPSNEPNTNSG